MSESMNRVLSGVQIGPASQSAGLQVFGLIHPPQVPLHYRTLDEALSESLLEVSEVSEGGSVPTLKLVNKSDGWVFLMAGEQLIGAKQNRVLNTSLMVGAHATTDIPVSCVEQSRWSYRSKNFGSHGTSSHTKLRKVMNDSVTASYFASATPRSDQGEVWREVSRKLHSVQSTSDTMALEQAYTDTKPLLDRFNAEIVCPTGCTGVVFALHGVVVGLDLFDQPATLQKLWPKLVRGYALDAIEPTMGTQKAPVTVADIAAWLQKLQHIETSNFPSPGLGEDMRMKSPEVVGAGLCVEDEIVHMQAFASQY